MVFFTERIVEIDDEKLTKAINAIEALIRKEKYRKAINNLEDIINSLRNAKNGKSDPFPPFMSFYSGVKIVAYDEKSEEYKNIQILIDNIERLKKHVEDKYMQWRRSKVKIELIVQKNCPKCDWFKEFVLPALELKGFKIETVDASKYTLDYYIAMDIEHTPALQIWNHRGECLAIDKGLTLKNVEQTIREFCEISV